MTDLAGFRTEVSSVLGLDNTASSDEQSLIDGWVNEAVTVICERSGCNATLGTMTFTANQNNYTLDTDILSIIDGYVTSGTTDYELIRTTPAEIIRWRRNSSPSGPSRYFYAVAGFSTMMVYPTPTSADTVTLLYVARPATLSASSDTPSEIPTEYHWLVTTYAKMRGGDYDEDQSSAQGQRYRQEFEEGLKMFKRALSLKGGHRLAPALVPPRRRRIIHDPSTSPWQG